MEPVPQVNGHAAPGESLVKSCLSRVAATWCGLANNRGTFVLQDGVEKVSIETPARLHLGFLDLHGGLGRSYGGLGMAIDGFGVRLEAFPAAVCGATGPAAPRAARVAGKVCAALQLRGAVHIRIQEAIPPHVGLGSGTQLDLAVARAILELWSLSVPLCGLGLDIGRRSRSGIGMGVFDQGGLVVDGGYGEESSAPPVLCRLEVPASWRFLLVRERCDTPYCGDRERQAFNRLGRMSEEGAGRLCRLVLMGVLPAVCERNCATFGRALSSLQEGMGAHFSSVQGGSFSSAAVAGALRWLRRHGALGIGQSSWGPTGYAVYPDPESADAAREHFERHHGSEGGLQLQVVAARNTGACVRRHGVRAVSA